MGSFVRCVRKAWSLIAASIVMSGTAVLGPTAIAQDAADKRTKPVVDVLLDVIEDRTEVAAKRRNTAEAGMSDGDIGVRRAIVDHVGSLPTDDAVPLLVRSLQDSDSEVRRLALMNLIRFSSHAKAALPAIIEQLDDINVAGNAAILLREFGPEAKPATQKLVELLQMREFQDEAVLALEKIDPTTLGNLPNAQSFIRKAKEKERRTLEPVMNMFIMHANKSPHYEAIPYWKDAADIADRLGKTTLAHTLRLRLASSYLMLFQFDTALGIIESGLETIGKSDADARQLQSEYRIVLAQIKIDQGRIDDAVKDLMDVVASLPQLPASVRDLIQQKANLALGIAHKKRGDRKSAIEAFERTITLGGDQATQLAGHWSLGELLLDSGDVDAAEEHLDAAQQNELFKSRSQILLAQIDLARHRYSEAVQKATESRKLATQRLWKKLHTVERQHRTLTMLLDDSDSLFRALIIAGQLPQQFAKDSATWVLNAKAVGLEDEKNDRWKGITELEALRLKNELRKIRAKLSQTERRSKVFAGDPTADRTLGWLLQREKTVSMKLALARDPESSLQWVECVEVQSRIPRDSVLVEFSFYPQLDPQAGIRMHYVAWIIPPLNDGDVTRLQLGSTEEIDEAILTFHKRIRQSTSASDAIDASLKKLSLLLLHPLEKELRRYKGVIISPDESLWLVPWSSLITEDRQYLCTRHALSLISTGREFLPSPSKRTSQGAIVVGDPNFNMQSTSHGDIQNTLEKRVKPWQRLPATARECRDVTNVLQRLFTENITVFLGDEATESAIANVKQPRMMLIATHGFFDYPTVESSGPDSPNQRLFQTVGSHPSAAGAHQLDIDPLAYCGIVLAGANQVSGNDAFGVDDGVLTGLEIASLDLAGTDLVVLSACDTGVQSIQSLTQVDGLRHAFHSAGAKHVLGSLWRVPDTETTRLMKTLFEKIAEGHSSAEALQLAQLEMIRNSNGDSGMPYYWGAWTVSGVPSSNWGKTTARLNEADRPHERDFRKSSVRESNNRWNSMVFGIFALVMALLATRYLRSRMRK